MVNVEDTARLHVAAPLKEDVSGERLFAFADPINYRTLVFALKKVDPSKSEYPAPPKSEEQGLEYDFDWAGGGVAEESWEERVCWVGGVSWGAVCRVSISSVE
jgi:hypothetical protein